MKGISIMTALVSVTVVLSVINVGITVNFASSLNEKSRVETLPLVDKRVESTIYMTSGLEEGQVQMNFNDEYGLNVLEDGTKKINYSSDAEIVGSSSSASAVLDPPVSFTIEESGTSDKFCIEKNSDIVLKLGAC